MSHWFDPGEDGEPYSAVIRLTGERAGIRGRPKPADTFVKEETIDGIVPGSGPASITTWVYGLQPGEWTVTGEWIRSESNSDRPAGRSRFAGAEPLSPAAWSWRRWAISTRPAGPLKTRWAPLAPLARMPAVMPGIFTLLVAVGGLIAFATQAAILARDNVSVSQSLLVSSFALVLGLIGAKLWYAVLHPGPWRQAILGGWAVDGFLFVALPVAVAALVALDLPIGTFLDATTPGLFFGVAIGRLGCFVTGCCAGRCTRSRWGVWSSDRRLGARRIPTQLVESAAGLVLGVATLLLVLGHTFGIPGAVFVASFGAYIVVRQLLLRLRSEPRRYSWRRSSLALRERA